MSLLLRPPRPSDETPLRALHAQLREDVVQVGEGRPARRRYWIAASPAGRLPL